jgi:hypothetical protein
MALAVLMVLRVRQDRKAHRVSRVPMALKAHRVFRALKARREK